MKLTLKKKKLSLYINQSEKKWKRKIHTHIYGQFKIPWKDMFMNFKFKDKKIIRFLIKKI